jgi:hypothetical protein
MKKTKYLGMKSGAWECTHVGVANIQPAFTKKYDEDGKKIRSKRAGHRSYYYIFERPTSDAKAMKMVRLGYWQAKNVFAGVHDVEYYAEKKKTKPKQTFTNKVSYSFYDRIVN